MYIVKTSIVRKRERERDEKVNGSSRLYINSAPKNSKRKTFPQIFPLVEIGGNHSNIQESSCEIPPVKRGLNIKRALSSEFPLGSGAGNLVYIKAPDLKRLQAGRQ